MEQKSAFDSRTIFAIIICMGIWWGWQNYLKTKYPEATTPSDTQTSSPNPEGSATKPNTEALALQASDHDRDIVPQPQKGPEQFWIYEDASWKVVVSNFGGRISEISLKKYTGKEDKNITIMSAKSKGMLLTTLEGASVSDFASAIYAMKAVNAETVELTASLGGLTVRKQFKMNPEKYTVNVHVEVSGKTSGVQRVDLDVYQLAPQTEQANKAVSFFNRGAGQEIQEYYFNHNTKNSRDIVTPSEGIQRSYEQTHMAALGSRYFTSLLFNRSNVLPEGKAFRDKEASVLRMSYPALEHDGQPLVIDADFYAGPKSMKQLTALDESAGSVIDLGVFSWIAVPLLRVMKWFYGILGNYGLAIIALTILVRALTFPFTYVSYKSMKAMQKIQPEIARLKEVYKGNTQALNVEMMKLMRENKVNPMGGCLPMLLQLPVFWALYQVLQNSIELYRAPFFGWIHDLSMKDPYYVLPVLMGVSMFAQQKLTPNTMDPAQARIMMLMPIMFSFLMFSLPSGLTLYIFVSTLFGIVQQLFMMRDRSGSQQAIVRRA